MANNISDLTDDQQALLKNLSLGVDVDPIDVLNLLDTIEKEFYRTNPQFQTSNWNWGSTTINGKVPVGNLEGMEGDQPAIDTVINGNRLLVNVGVRKAGTRVGIHVHESGGLTFVMGDKGAITDFVEGFPDRTFPAGTYYYMPYNTPMSASNLTNNDVQLIDIFCYPVDGAPITIIEDGYPGYNPPLYFDTASFVPATSDYMIADDATVQKEFAQFEILGGINNQRSSYVSFSDISEQSHLDLNLTTAGGGSIREELLPFTLSESFMNEISFFNGIYYNSGAGGDNIVGSEFNDFMRTNNGNDYVSTGNGNDVIFTGSNDDIIASTSGSNLIVAGSGLDTVSYDLPLSSYQIDIQNINNMKLLNVYEIEDNDDASHDDYLFEVELLTFAQEEHLDVRELLELNVKRLYNAKSNRHLYTSSEAEIDILIGNDWINEETVFASPFYQNVSVYRFYNCNQDSHFYTALERERDIIIGDKVAFSGWNYEGAAFSAYSTNDFPGDAVSVVRYLNHESGNHLYSTSSFEQGILDQDSKWLNEGIAWYGDPMVSTNEFA